MQTNKYILGYSRKKTNRRALGYKISRSTKEIASGISRGDQEKSCGMSWF